MSFSHHVIDSQVILWHLHDDIRLGADARAIMEDASAQLHVSAICLAEIGMAIEKRRVAIPSLDELLLDLQADPRMVIEPIDADVATEACRLTKLRDIHDRLIVATAAKLVRAGLNAALVTADREMANSGYVPVVWAHARK